MAYPQPYNTALGIVQQRVLGELFAGHIDEKGKRKKSQGYLSIMANESE